MSGAGQVRTLAPSEARTKNSMTAPSGCRGIVPVNLFPGTRDNELLAKAPGEVDVATRQNTAAEIRSAFSSSISHEIVTGSLEVGNAGECRTAEMSGAML